ncbi:MAG TPA: autotransporter domain-containing protein, partial [Steroidobacteraceae bacterium]|nr:autotransporter domain-containing protein [Steroidobacteraceae bacterium]
MKALLHSCAILVAAAALLAFAPRSEAQTQQTPLVALVNSATYGSNFGPVERAEAASLDAAFAIDLAKFCPEGCFPGYLNNLDGRIGALYIAIGQMTDPQTGLPSPNAPAIARQISIALRGIAPEELSAQHSASNEFASDQRDQIRSRIAALRNGAQGFAVNGFTPGTLANNTASLIGAASADPLPKDFSRWGGFLNGSYTNATRDVTALEDAFKITGADVSLGVDYRLSYHTVIGAMLTHTNRSLTFDVTSSIAGGNIDSNGLAAVLYASYDWDGGYL